MQAGATARTITLSRRRPRGCSRSRGRSSRHPPAQLTGSLSRRGARRSRTRRRPTGARDAFVYEVSDGALTAQGTITITVAAANIAPVADDDTADDHAGSRRSTIDVLAGDTDADGDDADRRRLRPTAPTARSSCTRDGVHVHAGPGLLRDRHVHLHHRRRLRRRRHRHRDGHRSSRRRSRPASRPRRRRPARVRRRSASPTSPTSGCASSTSTSSNAPFAAAGAVRCERAPFAAAGAVRCGGRRSPSSPRSLKRAPVQRRTPLSEIPVDYPGGWPALLAGTPLAGRADAEHHASRSSSRCTTRPARRPQALRDLTLEDVSFFDGTARRRQPGRVPDRGDPAGRRPLRRPQTWCDRLAADTDGDDRPARRSASAPTTTLLELDVDPDAAHGPRRASRSAPDPAGRQHRRLRRRPGARRPAERAQPLRHRRSARSASPPPSPPRPRSARCGSPTSRSTTRTPTTARYGRRDLVVDCSGAFACSGGGDPRPTPPRRARCVPERQLQDVGRAFLDHTVAGEPPISLAADRRRPAGRRSTSTT